MAIWQTEGELNVHDLLSQPTGFGTVAPDHMSPGGIDSRVASNVLFANDPSIGYYDAYGNPDIVNLTGALDNSTNPVKRLPDNQFGGIQLGYYGDQACISYTPSTNVQLFELVVDTTYSNLPAGATLTCQIIQDAAPGGPLGAQVGGNAYDELSRSQTMPLTSIANGGLTTFHFHLNKADASGKYYASGTTQDPVSLVAGTTYWFVITLGGGTTGNNTGGNIWFNLANNTVPGSSLMIYQSALPGNGYQPYGDNNLQCAFIISGWKISRSINGSFGGLTRQLANYDYRKLVSQNDVSAYAAQDTGSSNGATPDDLWRLTNDSSGQIVNDNLASHGPYFSFKARTKYLGFIQDMIENMNYCASGLDDYTTSTTIVGTTLSTPGAPTVTVTGTAGTTSYTYYVIAVDAAGRRTMPSTGTTVTNGNATLTTSNYNAISWGSVTGAVKYVILRGNTSTYLATVTGTSYNDQGALDSYGHQTEAYTPPTQNETGPLSWAYIKELVLYVDGNPVAVLAGGNSGHAYATANSTVSVLKQCTDAFTINPGTHTFKVQLRYYKYKWNGTPVGSGGSTPFSEANAVPDQIRFEGIELTPRVSYDNLAVYPYSAIYYVTTDGNGNAILTPPPPVGYTLIGYTGAYNPIDPPATSTALRCSVGANAIIINGGAATTQYKIRITMLISPAGLSL